MSDLVRRGRVRGLGVTLVTQRPATLNKDILTQAEVLIALRMTGPRDVQAIDEWVRLHADEDEAREVKASLSSLPIGTAWVWSPGWLELLRRVQIRRPRTFDSSATPRPGQARPAARRMAPVDLAALGEQIMATVERAKADVHQRQIVATLRVHSDRTWTITGDASRVPTQIAVYDAVSGRWVRLTEDPLSWALNLNTELRTGYLTARTIHPDTSP